MNTDNSLKLSVGIIVILVIAITVGYWWLSPQENPESLISRPFDRLLENNAEFEKGEQALKDGDIETAEKSFEAALAITNDPSEQAQIKYKIAIATLESDPIKAARLLTEISQDIHLSNHARAYAIQRAGQLHFENNDPKITETIFTGPYASLLTVTDIPLSYRKLFEHASTLYPLAISELRIARWYTLYSNEENKEQYLNTAHMKVVNADKDLTQLDTETNGWILPIVNLLKALVVDRMHDLGDSSLGDPKPFFETALASAVEQGDSEGSARLRFADYLARSGGNANKTEIVNLLEPLYTARGTKFPNSINELKDGRLNAFGEKQVYIRLAEIDPKLKTLLLDLGWTETDF